MGVFSSGVLAGLAKVGLVVVSIGGLSAGAIFAYQTAHGGSDEDPRKARLADGAPASKK